MITLDGPRDRKVRVIGNIERRQFAPIGKNALGNPIYREVQGADTLRYDPFRLYDLSARKIKVIDEYRILRKPKREDFSIISIPERALLKDVFGEDVPPLSKLAPHVALMNVRTEEHALAFANTYGLLRTSDRHLDGEETKQHNDLRRVYAKEIAEAQQHGWNPDLDLLDWVSFDVSSAKEFSIQFLRFCLEAQDYNNSGEDRGTLGNALNDYLDLATFNGHIADIHVRFAVGDFGLVPAIDCGDNLLAACILMAWLDMLEGYSYGKCGEHNEGGCGEWFLKRREDQRFCSHRCSNSASYARYKQKKQ